MNPTELMLDCLNLSRCIDNADSLAEIPLRNWELIWDTAYHQKIAPYLYNQLKKSGAISQVPSQLAEKFRQSALISARWKLKIENELHEIIQVLNEANVPTIALKGTHLAWLIYEDPALRPVDDIDLLVKQQHLLNCDHELLGLGYGPSSKQWLQSGYQESHQHLPPYLKTGAFPIEIHWTISHPKHQVVITSEELWTRARSTTLIGVETNVLSLEDLLLHLSIHTCLEDLFSSGIRPLIDISETIMRNQDQLNWDIIFERSRKWQVQKAVFLTLTLTAQLLQLRLPDRVLNNLKPANTNQLVIDSAKQKITSQIQVSSNFARLWGQESIRQKTSALFNRLFPPPGEMTRIYSLQPGRLRLYLAYLQRIKDLAPRYGASSIRMLSGDHMAHTITNPDIVLTSWLESG